MVAHLLQNIVNGQRFVVHLHGTLDDALCQTHVDIGIVDHAISQQRIDDTLQVAYTAIGRLCNEADDILRNLQTVTTTLCMQDIHAQLHIGLLQLCNQTTGETGQQTILQPLQVYRRTVAGQNNLLAKTEQMVKDVEEGGYRLLCRSPLLYIVDDEHVNGLVEIDKVIDCILAAGICKLHLEQACRYIEHTLARIHFLTTHANGIDQMRLATT